MPRVAAVVVNWNGVDDTVACVESLLAQQPAAPELHVVDNGSDTDADALAVRFGARIRLHRNRENLGFTGGVATALAPLLADPDVTWIALLNNDAVAEPGWIAALLAAAERTPRAGLYASCMLLADDPTRIENTGIVLLSNGDALPRGRGARRGSYDAPARLLGACGGAMLLRAAMLREVGGLREDFFANFEDLDLSLRAFAAGWDCIYVPDAVVRHKLSRTVTRVRDEEFRVRAWRNLTWALCVNLPWPVLLWDLPWILLHDLLVSVVAPLSGQPETARRMRAGRLRAWRERAALCAARRQVQRMRRTAWWRFWWRQQAFLPAYLRTAWNLLRGKQRGLLD